MSRKLGDGRRNLTLEERINIAEGEDSLSESDDGLDMVRRSGKDNMDIDDYLDAIGVENSDVIVVSSDSDDSHERKRKRLPSEHFKGERVAFDDDEDSDAAYNAFKKRKSDKRKQAIASTKRAKSKGSKGSVIGKRPKSVIPLSDEKRGGGSSDDENALMETTLPEYLQMRRGSWEELQEKEGSHGLRFPPIYDDVYIEGDERMQTLKERPDLGDQPKQRPYSDIKLLDTEATIPGSIAQYLRDYQVDGTAFLFNLFLRQRGGLLGDDMGLGKTIQVIAFLTAAFGKTGDERDDKRMRKVRRMGDDRWYPRVLIICPGGLMSNWKTELARWGWWQVDTYHGSLAAKDAALAAALNGRLEIMITTYTTYRLNSGSINNVRWDCVIADECHIIKERRAEITLAMNDVNALCRIGLTGTAIQNKFEELWVLVNWTNPGSLGPHTMWKHNVAVPIKVGQSHDATMAQLEKGRLIADGVYKYVLPKFFLRRTKALIAHQLPKKNDQVVFCPMTDVQTEAYTNFVESEVVRTIIAAQDPCPCGSKKTQGHCCHAEIDGKPLSHFTFPCLTTLGKLSNHVALLLPSGEADRERHDKDMKNLKTALPSTWRELYSQRDSILNYANISFCGKWKVLRKLLKLWHESGDKVLIFSHSVRLLRMLQMLFNSTTSYNVSYLDGSMKYEDRQQVVDDYNSDPGQFVFLISTRAGGVGLNITSANKVVVVDPNWNPSYDLQAQDRAYRIGQTRDVDVFRLVSAGTIEESVYARQIYKQQQANIVYTASVERRYFTGIQGQKGQQGDIFGVKNLLAPLSANVKLRDIINKTNVAESRAGIEIAGLDLEASQEDDDDVSSLLDDTKEDAAMTLLAAEIIDGPAARRKALQKMAKKKDAVQAILASAGVQYTHQNAEVIGTSKIETKISSRAAKYKNNYELDSKYAFARQASQEDETSRLHPRARSSPGADGEGSGEDDDDPDSAQMKYKFRPPVDVRKRQFCTMAKHFGYDNVTEFALVVEGWTQEQRRDCLDKFYQARRARLAELT